MILDDRSIVERHHFEVVLLVVHIVLLVVVFVGLLVERQMETVVGHFHDFGGVEQFDFRPQPGDVPQLVLFLKGWRASGIMVLPLAHLFA